MNSPLRMREIEKRVSDAAPLVRFMGVQKSYDGTTLVVKGLDLDVARGEFLTLLGPSGSGKTTCLMMLAGFELPTAGEILLDGRPISRLPPNRRGIGVVFQNYALFPHMTVAENVAFPLSVRAHVARRDRRPMCAARSTWCSSRASISASPRSSPAASSSASRSRARSCSSPSSS